ncbi:MAG: isochorismatase family cysteine hydrolase [Actinocatenispora sp.]
MGQNDVDGLPASRVAVLLVDFQNQFCHPAACGSGPVGNTNNARAAHRATEFAARAAAIGAPVVYSQQVYDPERSTPRQRHWDEQLGLCRAGSWEAELFVEPVPAATVITKYRFDIWQSTEFLDFLDRHEVEGLVIAGVELRCCVLFAAMGADERGYRFVVPQDLVSGLDEGDATYNGAARELLRATYDAPDHAEPLLTSWLPS